MAYIAEHMRVNHGIAGVRGTSAAPGAVNRESVCTHSGSVYMHPIFFFVLCSLFIRRRIALIWYSTFVPLFYTPRAYR